MPVRDQLGPARLVASRAMARLGKSLSCLRQSARSSLLIDGDKDQAAVCDFAGLVRLSGAARPSADVDRHGTAALGMQPGMEIDEIADPNWGLELKALNSDGCDAALSTCHRDRRCGDICLCQEPTTEDVPIKIGIGRSCEHAQCELPFPEVGYCWDRWLRWLMPMRLPFVRLWTH